MSKYGVEDVTPLHIPTNKSTEMRLTASKRMASASIASIPKDNVGAS